MSNTTNVISHARLERIATGWVIRYLDGPRRAEALELFGTSIIPLPFTAEASLPLVAQVLEATPGTAVDLDNGHVTMEGA